MQHLAHGGVIVSGLDALDVEAAVVGRHHAVALVDDAGCLGGLAHRVTDVEALDAQPCRVVKGHAQHVEQVLGASLLRAVDGQMAGERDAGIGLGLLQPAPARLLLRLRHPGHRMAGLGTQHRQRLGVSLLGTDDQPRHHAAGIVLHQKGIEHAGERSLVQFADMAGEMCLVAKMTATPHHRQVQADLAVGSLDGDDVGIGVGVDLHRLLVQHVGQRADAVAQHRRLLEAQCLGRGQHLRLHLGHDLLVPALQEGDGRPDIPRIGLFVDQADTGGTATVDLVLQAGT